MYISKAIKITMDKASKVAKDTFKNPVKMELLKKKLSKTVNTQDFKTLKIILETGSAVGGVIMVFEYYYNPPAQASQVEELQKKLEEKIEEIKNEIKNDGLKAQEVKTETIQNETIQNEELIEKLKQENAKNKEIIESKEKTIVATKTAITLVAFLFIMSIIQPAKAFEIIEEVFK